MIDYVAWYVFGEKFVSGALQVGLVTGPQWEVDRLGLALLMPFQRQTTKQHFSRT